MNNSTQNDATRNDLKAGDKVKNCYGETRTVAFITGCQVFTLEESNSWYHPTKLTLIVAK